LKSQQREGVKLKTTIRSKDDQIEDMNIRHRQLNDQIVAKQNDIDKLTFQAKQQNFRISEMTNNIEFERTENAAKLKSHDILKKKLESQEEENSTMMDELMEKTNRIRVLQKENRELKKSSGVFPKDLEDKETKLLETEEKLRQLQRTSKRQVADLEHEVILLKAESRRNKAQIDHLSRHNQELSQQSHKLVDQVAEANEDELRHIVWRLTGESFRYPHLTLSIYNTIFMPGLQKELDETKKKYQDAMKTVKTMSDTLRRAMKSHDEITQKLHKLEEEIQRQKRRATRAESLVSNSTFE